MKNQRLLSFAFLLFGVVTLISCKSLCEVIPIPAYIVCIVLALLPMFIILIESQNLHWKDYGRDTLIPIIVAINVIGIGALVSIPLTFFEIIQPSPLQFIFLGIELMTFGAIWYWYQKQKQLSKDCEYAIKRLSIFEPYSQVTFEKKDITIDTLIKWIEQRNSLAIRYVKYVTKTNSLTE